MTAATFRRKLADGADLRATHGAMTFESGSSRWTMTTVADAIERVGACFRELRLSRVDGAAAQPLAVRAQTVADRVTGLMEGLVLVEVDELRQIAQLRSDAPAVSGGTRQYYEIAMSGGTELVMARYEYDGETKKRQAVPFSLTYDTLAKLLYDLTAE